MQNRMKEYRINPTTVSRAEEMEERHYLKSVWLRTGKRTTNPKEETFLNQFTPKLSLATLQNTNEQITFKEQQQN